MLLLLLFSSNVQNASAIYNEKKAIDDYSVEKVVDSTIPSLGCAVNVDVSFIKKDCTVRVSSGSIEVEVTFHDVSWWTCAKLKVGAWWKRTF